MSGKPRWSALIVDDEWLVREELKQLLADYPEIEVSGEAGSVRQAAELLGQRAFDVIFLDIQMPGALGFELLDQAEVTAKLIFITAYDQYAIKAFEVNALDYLLKPIQRERLGKAIARLAGSAPATPQPRPRLGHDDIVYVVIAGSLKFLQVAQIRYITAGGNYSYLYYQEHRRELVTKSLREWEEILPPDYFLRIHRSSLVNFEFVERIEKRPNYSHLVYIRGIEQPVVMSRRYAARLQHLLAR
ncbi:MAG TPA: LytTR family DNA-binding domain-containing protein [bacterium]|nr:LytTR family DNA-binding domain-containing protein [bacterium]HQG44336.1 LytTR family DNA-binding domain-containing protein [bacterium]HQI49586.1 LytTR family DNA-binding domain-containing protein [bacterium]HQJ65939.1 LytTR family DNA-binding domain-containing protein [bacterium]